MDPYRVYKELSKLQSLLLDIPHVLCQQSEKYLQMNIVDGSSHPVGSEPNNLPELKKLCNLYTNILKLIHYHKSKNKTDCDRLMQPMPNDSDERQSDDKCDSTPEHGAAAMEASNIFQLDLKFDKLFTEIKLANLQELYNSLYIPKEIDVTEFFELLVKLKNRLQNVN